MFNRYNVLILVLGLSLTTSIWAGVHITLTGTVSDNNIGLVTQASRAGSASFAFDLGTHFRLGLTHRQGRHFSEGYYEVEGQEGLYRFKTSTNHEIANSLELTVILYIGRVFVPYVKIGLVKKNYVVIQDDLGKSISLPPAPIGGFGVGIRLNKSFSLKLSQTFSQGAKIPYPDAEPEGTLDTFSSVGITYSL